MGNIETGKRGEEIAVEHLIATGYEILARNVRFSNGEIDIVAREIPDPGRLRSQERAVAIVEVKTRSSTRFGTGAEAITPAKYGRLRRLAAQWMRENPGHGSVRIDIVSILLDGSRYELEHIEGVLP